MREVEDRGRSSSFMTTVPLYCDDSYIKEFDATVLRSGPGYVMLDRTAFYPESGGQPTDIGLLHSGSQTFQVLKVAKRGPEIFHYVDGILPEGAAVHGVLDWDSRYLNMRRHSAEHLLTGLFERAGAGPKVYADVTRLEFKPSELTEEQVREVEDEFNRTVEADLPIKTYYVARSEVEVGEDERKRAFLEKIPKGVDRLRMVEIPGCDVTFCFGTHVKSTEEIGRLAGLVLMKKRKRRRVVLFFLE